MKSDMEIKYLELLRKPVKTKAEMQELDEIGRKFQNQLRNETKGLLDDLAKVGVDVSSVWDLVNTKEPYPDAIDVLIKHLSRNYHPRNKEGIVRALIVPEAKGKANESLFEEYDRTPKEMESLRWAIGYALANLMMKKDTDRIIGIVKDADNGKSRGELIKTLGTLSSMRTLNNQFININIFE